MESYLFRRYERGNYEVGDGANGFHHIIQVQSSGGDFNSGTSTSPGERVDDETPVNRGISHPPPERTRPLPASQAKRSWDNALDKLKETTR